MKKEDPMDKSKKIMIGAIGTVVVAGGVIIGLILGNVRQPKADLSTIHTEASRKLPQKTNRRKQKHLKQNHQRHLKNR